MDNLEQLGQEEVEISIRGKSATFIILEKSATEIDELFAAVNSAKTEERKTKAAKELPAKIIAACVQRADGSAISLDDATGFKFSLVKKLQEAVMRVNGITDDEDKVKNA